MKFRNSTLRAIAAAFLLTACGNGNSLDVVLDGTPQTFNKGVDATREQGDGTWLLKIEGNDDPPRVMDGWSSVSLTLNLDDSAIDQLVRSSPVRIHGTTSSSHNEDWVRTTTTFEAEEGHAEGVKSVLFERACYCAPSVSERQSFDGTLSLEKLNGGRLHVVASLAIDWDQSFSSGDPRHQHAQLDADVIAANP